MPPHLEKLTEIASSSLCPEWQAGDEQSVRKCGPIGIELLELLQIRNGFYAFESAFHLFPLGSSPAHMSLQTWNAPKTWRSEYGHLVSQEMLFFAEDAYGNQFAIKGDEVVLFYSEFGGVDPIAKSLAEWSEKLLSDWRGLSGYELAHDWQIQNRALNDGERLIPKIPFVVGGKYEVSNLYAGRAVDAMRFRGSLAQQLADVPDGTPINLEIIPPGSPVGCVATHHFVVPSEDDDA